MKKGDELKLIDPGGNEGYSFKEEDQTLENLAGQFYLLMSEKARNLGLINTGDMISQDNFKTRITREGQNTRLDIYMKEYAFYVDKGVKGVKSSSNAPNSPYQFKNYGMSEKGRASILKSVTDGKLKVRDTSKTGYGRIGLEGKAKETPSQAEINQREAEQIIYMIKKYGIKTTNFMTDSFNQWVKDFKPQIIEALTKKVKAQLIIT